MGCKHVGCGIQKYFALIGSHVKIESNFLVVNVLFLEEHKQLIVGGGVICKIVEIFGHFFNETTYRGKFQIAFYATVFI